MCIRDSLICIHAGNPRVPPRVLASGPKPCGANYRQFNIHRISFRLKPLHVCRVNLMQNFHLSKYSKNLDQICLCQIFNFSSIGALRHSKIFVNRKCQSHGNKRHRLRAVRKGGYMRSHEWQMGLWRTLTLLLNVLPRHIIACSLVFSTWP